MGSQGGATTRRRFADAWQDQIDAIADDPLTQEVAALVSWGFTRADALEMTRLERLAYLQVCQEAWERANPREG